ncbi:spore coat protein [Paenibacillus physcomitrellae]|uniref:Spore coat protein F-like protein YraD n=1 Tax=Paenibacillus physcomitrellae TaxID=1619311 RepID=A0ABQ1FSP3_9BACL|nr:spore coat protein [Paenibacillus physcomitrellae]GGA28994.1 spore coat protein F-like protein YraD [Paenibacillus physcomitrellae]
MNPLLERLMGMQNLTDQIIATDFLNNAKSGVRNYAMALTECTSPDVKAVLTKQLEEAIQTHEQIVHFLVDKGYYRPFNVEEQRQLDLQNIKTAQGIL